MRMKFQLLLILFTLAFSGYAQSEEALSIDENGDVVISNTLDVTGNITSEKIVQGEDVTAINKLTATTNFEVTEALTVDKTNVVIEAPVEIKKDITLDKNLTAGSNLIVDSVNNKVKVSELTVTGSLTVNSDSTKINAKDIQATGTISANGDIKSESIVIAPEVNASEKISSKSFEIYNDASTVTATITNNGDINSNTLTTDGKVTAGALNISESKATVSAEGDLVAQSVESKGEIKGTSISTSGTLSAGSVKISNGKLEVDVTGNLTAKSAELDSLKIIKDEVEKVSITNEGAIATKSTLNVTGVTTLDNNVNVNGNLTVQSDKSIIADNITLSGDATVSGTLKKKVGNIETTYDAFPVGTIIMYNGNSYEDGKTLPGWYLCNGQTQNSQITPDLRGKFIMVGETSGAKGGSSTITIDKENLPSHNIDVTYDKRAKITPTGTIGQAGKHRHEIKVYKYKDGTGLSDNENDWEWDDDGTLGSKYTQYTGEHTHALTMNPIDEYNPNVKARFTGDNNSITIIPPYYKLIFIMKCE